MGTIAENKKTIDNFKDFNSSILTGMLANNPEIYSAFAKVLDQVEKKYFTSLPKETGTRQWTLKDFDDTKIILDTPEKSKRFQELLLSLGCEWNGLDVPDENLRKSVNLTDKKYLSIIAKENFMVVSTIEGFNRFSNKEIFYEEIFPEETGTKQWTLDDFKYTKIIVDTPEKSKKFQELVLGLGAEWFDQDVREKEKRKLVNFTDKKYLVIGDTGAIFYIEQKHNWASSGKREIFYDDIFPKETKKLVWRFKTKQELIDDGLFDKKLGIPEDDYNSFLGKPLSEIYAKERFKNLDEAITALENNMLYLGKKQWAISFNSFTQKPLPAEDKKQEPGLTKEFYQNTKIRLSNPNQSANYQRFLNKLGFEWSDGGIVKYADAPFLLVDQKNISYTFDGEYFIKSEKKEIFYKDILPFIRKTVLNPQKTEKQILLKHTETKPKIDDGFSLSIETDPAKLKLPLWFEKNNGDRKAPTQSAGELKRWVTGKINEIDYVQMILETKFRGNDGYWYKINVGKTGTWTWKKA